MIHVIIPVHNRLKKTITCLKSLEKQNIYKNLRIIIVNDGSNDGTKEHITKNFPQVNIINGDGSLFWGGAINLGIDSNKTDQNIRGVINLPKGTGKKIKVAVLAKGEKQNEAKEAGADIVGETDLIDSISAGKIDFDLIIATPDMMPSIGKVAKILGPKGLMPNPN